MPGYFRINELGRLMTDETDACSTVATGKEYNPLTEFNKYGQANPFQDPTRGRIDSCLFDEYAADPDHFSICLIGKSLETDGQDFLLQNTKDLIGRSITAYTIDPFSNQEEAIGCCTIGWDEAPSHYSAAHH